MKKTHFAAVAVGVLIGVVAANKIRGLPVLNKLPQV